PATDAKNMAHQPTAMECQSCHGSWNSGCWGCHLSVRLNTKAKELHVGDDESRGYTDYYPQLLRADNNMMGINGVREGNKLSQAGVRGFSNDGANFVGDYVYVAEGSGGVRGVRIADGYEPKPVIGSWLHSTAYPDDFKKFVAGGRRLGESHRAGSTNARSVARRGELLLVADGAGGLRVYDIAQIANKSVAQP